ncbi:MAG: DUF4396 domain-containing protein [Corynebacteriales bacterium]|nr:DUF4396 domain-containing protein [Mycobacteriales bacterium]
MNDDHSHSRAHVHPAHHGEPHGHGHGDHGDASNAHTPAAHVGHEAHTGHTGHTMHHGHSRQSLTKQAVSATLHCLTGCAIGEVLGLVIASALGWSTVPSIALAVVLAFLFGYSLTLIPVLRAGVAITTALGLVFAVDTVSILVMEIVDNGIMLVIPGAMHAGLDSFVFWGSLTAALAIAFVVTVPVNRWLIAKGKGHALVHQYH